MGPINYAWIIYFGLGLTKISCSIFQRTVGIPAGLRERVVKRTPSPSLPLPLE